MKPVKHTPGPWHVEPGYSPTDCRILSSKRFCIALPTSGLDADLRGPQPTMQANARLMAASPELLETVVEVENWLDHHGDTTDPGAMGLLAMCRYVIAKATEER